MYTEIKNKRFFLPILIVIYFINANSLFSQQAKDIPINVSKPIYLKPNEVNYKKIDKADIKKEYRLLQNSSVFRTYVNTNLIDPSLLKNSPTPSIQVKQNKNLAGQYLYTYNQQEVPQVIEQHLSQNPFVNEQKIPTPKLIEKFRVILDENDRVYFTDGSLLIKFKNQVNYSEFAQLNNLILKKEYLDLNIGVYVHDSFNTLEEKINTLQDMNLTTEVQYNVIDPYVIAE